MVKAFIKYSLLIACLSGSGNIVAQVLIVHPQNPTSQLSRNTLRAMFAMRTPQWSDGTPVQVFVLKDSDPVHTSFCKHILGMFPYQLRRVWDRQVFSGTGIAPITVRDEQEMRERVAQTEGSIGYILPENVNSSVKILDKES